MFYIYLLIGALAVLIIYYRIKKFKYKREIEELFEAEYGKSKYGNAKYTDNPTGVVRKIPLTKRTYEKTNNIREQIIWFAAKMEEKLGENDHKEHWSTVKNKFLLIELLEEVKELNDAVFYEREDEEIIRECADVANYAMMIADNIRIKAETGKKQK